VPGFANDNGLAVLNLACHEVQISRGFTDDYRESGNAGRRLDASGSTVNRFERNARPVQFFPNVTDDFKSAQLE
jgi:hypothetical protein